MGKKENKKEELTPSMHSILERLATHLAEANAEARRKIAEANAEAKKDIAETEKKLAAVNAETEKKLAAVNAETEKIRTETEKIRTESEAAFNRKMAEINDRITKGDEEMRKMLADLAKSRKDTAKEMKELRKNFNNQWGHLMESLVEGDLVNLLVKRGIEVTGTTSRLRVDVGDKIFELDIVARNCRDIVVTEVKSRLSTDDVRRFLAKLAVVKEVFHGYKDKRMYAAVAYLRADDGVVAYAERKGLFVIRTTGDSAYIINKDGFDPKLF